MLTTGGNGLIKTLILIYLQQKNINYEFRLSTAVENLIVGSWFCYCKCIKVHFIKVNSLLK